MTDVAGELAKYGAPSWLILAVVIVVWLLSTKWAAHIPGKLGAWSRWITNRQERALDREMSLRQRVDKAVAERVAREMAPVRKENESQLEEIRDLRKDIAAERRRHREAMEAERQRHRDELDRIHRDTLEPIKAERDLLASWSVFIARWWHDKERTLAEMGVTVPPPPWPAFQHWLAEQRQIEESSRHD